MGAPSVNIAFIEKSATAIQRGERGTIAMLLKESAVTTADYVVYSVTDIPSNLSEANKTAVKQALIGYQTAPKKILLHLIKSDSVESNGYTDALAYFATQKWDYLVVPTAETDTKATEVANWIKEQRTAGMTYKTVLPNVTADNEGIVNVTTGCKKGEVEYSAEAMCARVAGIICGTPLTMSCTYAPLSEMTDCDRLSASDLDAAVDAGKFVFMWDGEKVKVCRAVNSFTSTTDTKGGSFKKIKVVDTMDIIKDDIRMTAQDSYIGKYANSYDNKCLLVTAINSYFAGLVRDGVLASGSCQIDLDAQRSYFAEKGGKVVVNGEEKALEDCSDDEIKQGNTGSKVFLKAVISILDAIEDISLEIYIG